MQNFINIGLAFIEGFSLIVSPCILPVLPILLSASLTGSRKRPFGIILGFILTFTLFTFFSRFLVSQLHLNLIWLRYFSYALLTLFGCIMLSTHLSDRFALITNRFANWGLQLSSKNQEEGFLSGILIGSLVGLVWTPCAGPILAAVIVQAATQQSDTGGFLTMFSFAIGAGVPMLFFALFGRRMLNKMTFFKAHSKAVRRALGIILISAVSYLVLSENISFLSQNSSTSLSSNTPATNLINALPSPYPAPDLTGIQAWINSEAKHLAELKGKVVLIDFWTYSCINCIRTLPYLKAWYAKYHDKGFEIIGIHTPEFEFEKNLNNVRIASEKFELKYPIALDSSYSTWEGYHNKYWPAHYLIDKSGNIVYTHFGEGAYDITENNIRYLLNIRNKETPRVESLPQHRLTPETYLGFNRAQNFSSPQANDTEEITKYTLPNSLDVDHWALEGPWLIDGEKIISKSSKASLKLHFEAKKVFVVMGNRTKKTIHAHMFLNGKKLHNERGQDVSQGRVEVKEHRLYEIVNLSNTREGLLQIQASSAGLEIFAFTFGN